MVCSRSACVTCSAGMSFLCGKTAHVRHTASCLQGATPATPHRSLCGSHRSPAQMLVERPEHRELAKLELNSAVPGGEPAPQLGRGRGACLHHGGWAPGCTLQLTTLPRPSLPAGKPWGPVRAFHSVSSPGCAHGPLRPRGPSGPYSSSGASGAIVCSTAGSAPSGCRRCTLQFSAKPEAFLPE